MQDMYICTMREGKINERSPYALAECHFYLILFIFCPKTFVELLGGSETFNDYCYYP